MIVCLSMVYLKSAILVHSTCVAFLIELKFSSVGFCGEGKTREHAEKCLGAKKEPITTFSEFSCAIQRIHPNGHLNDFEDKPMH